MNRKYLIAIGVLILLLVGAAGCGVIKVIQREEDDSQIENSGQDVEGGDVSGDDNAGAESDYTGGDSSAAVTTEVVDRSDEEYEAISNTMESWWFMRNDTHTTPGCQEDFDITPYHAYYVNADTTEKVIYLTFDCGYENGYTARILDTLKEKDVKAIFFVTQYFIEQNPDLIIRMKEEGHLVGNHTNHHPCLPELSIEEQREEISSCAEYMKEATGYDMDPYIRPPKGEYSERTLQLFEDMGYCTVFWSMAYLDYEVDNQPSPEYVVQHFEKYYHPGAVPLLHNVSSANTEALPQIIENLREAGYRFGTVDEFCHF
jgi:peptidoglycan-N-acetylmuramic acid deacetylase